MTFILLFGLLVSCRTTEKQGPTFSQTPLNPKGLDQVSSNGRIDDPDVSMQLQVKRRDGWRFVRNGDDVESGDRVRVIVELQRRYHVHVLYETRDGVVPLFPKEGQAASLGAGLHEIPPRDSQLDVLLLDDTPGRETLYLVASRRPLRRVDDQLAEHVARLRSARREVTDREGLRLQSKGGDQAARRDGSAVDGAVNDDGVVVLTFEVNHVD